MAYVVLPRTHNLVLRIVQELVPVSQPPHHPRDHEEHWEHVSRESHRAVNDTAVEVHVRVKLTLDEVGIGKGNTLQLHCDFDQLFLSSDLEHLLSDTLDDLGSGIVVFVDTMTESVEQAFLVLDVLDELRDVGFLADRLQHPQHSLVGTTVLASVKSTSGTCDGGVDIYTRRGEVADGSSGAVELVFSMQDEEDFECTDEFGMGLEVALVELVKHVEEVLDVAGVLMGLVVLATDPVTVGVGSDGGYTTKETVNLLIPHLLVLVDALANEGGVLLGVEGGEGGNCTAEHAHGVCVVAEGVHHREQILVDKGVLHDLLGEGAQFLLGGQLAPKHQVCHL